ncbi:MAG: glutamyl-tRNA reductase [Thermoleophilia bacterium]|nr:glutamyl-tRNA reductase [Thermoleophilia bacterium]
MHLAVLGINHKTACVEVRERVALTDDGCGALVRALTRRPDVSGAVAVSTCNRTEVYVSGPALPLRDVTLEGLCSTTTVCRPDVEGNIYYKEDGEAVAHLFAVASSLDSMVLGEAQILHQLKEAYRVAEEAGATGATLNKLLRRSFEVGKRVRTETRIGENSLSIASVSVDLAHNVFGSLENLAVLVIGAGEMAELVVTHLQGHGLSRIHVANRTFERALELAGRFGGEAVRYEAVEDHLVGTDIVISSTAASEPIIRRADMERVMRRRKNKPVFLIDIAVPRDIDPAVNRVYNTYLYDIDDLQDVVASNLDERQREAMEARRIVDEEVRIFQEWLGSLVVVPTLVSFRDWATGVKDQELEKFLGRMPDLTEDERAKVVALAHSIVNKLIHPATTRIKDLAGEDEGQRYAEALGVLFGLNGGPAGNETPPSGGEAEKGSESSPD